MNRPGWIQAGIALALSMAGMGLASPRADARPIRPHVEIAVDGGGRVVAAIGGGGHHQAGVVRLTSAGELDASFAGDGTIGPRASKRALALALAPDGRVVVAQELEGGHPVLRRYFADGRPDRSYGRRGTTPIPAVPKDRLLAQPRGHVVALFERICPSWLCGYRASYLEILRYGGGGGLASRYTKYTGSWEFQAAGVDPRGYFVVAGSNEAGTTFARFRPGGGIDPGLGGPDGLEVDAPGYREPKKPGEEALPPILALAIQPDRAFVLALDSGGAAISRRKRDGSLDTGFGNGGEAYCGPETDQQGPTAPFDALGVAPDGAILAAGGRAACGLVRYLPGGEPDPAFVDGGHVNLEALGFPRPLALGMGPDGEVVLAGWDGEIGSVEFVRLTADGRLDPAFGSGGTIHVAGF